jgi:hypothetical protein
MRNALSPSETIMRGGEHSVIRKGKSVPGLAVLERRGRGVDGQQRAAIELGKRVRVAGTLAMEQGPREFLRKESLVAIPDHLAQES